MRHLYLCLFFLAACAPDIESEDAQDFELLASSVGGDASRPINTADAGTPNVPTPATLVVGVNTHNYGKPMAYGYTAADGADRMGNALRALNTKYVRGAIIGDVEFLARLRSFGVTHALLGLDAKSYGKPFDPAKLRDALVRSVNEAKRVGLTVIAEGLNEWDLFRKRPYNDGVEPAGVSEAEFILVTQKALYEAAKPLGIQVLGPSVGHPFDQDSLDFFPDVSPYVDIVNMHFYFGNDPDTLPVASYVFNHQRYQGAGKPVWITETGISAYAGVSEAKQADITVRGLTRFLDSKLIAVVFDYELLDTQLPGFQNWQWIPDSGEYHFGLFRYGGAIKPAGTAVAKFIAEH